LAALCDFTSRPGYYGKPAKFILVSVRRTISKLMWYGARMMRAAFDGDAIACVAHERLLDVLEGLAVAKGKRESTLREQG
jgi:hypothetical protein